MLGQRIRSLRQSFGWSQVTVAQRLGVSKQTVCNWESGVVQPSVEMLEGLADLFHVTTDFLLGREDIPRISVQGLPDHLVAHLSLLVDDYYRKGASETMGMA